MHIWGVSLGTELVNSHLMSFLKHFRTKKFLLLAFLILASACTPKDRVVSVYNNTGSTTNGGGDMGGTNAIGSSIGDVEDILNNEKRLKQETSTILNNFLQDFRASNDLNSIQVRLNGALALWCQKQKIDCPTFTSNDFIKQIQIEKHYDTQCIDGDNQSKDASVDLNTKAPIICMNVKNLARFPKESLRKQIYTVYIHEVTHLLGEVDSAIVIQNYLLKEYDRYITQNTFNTNTQNLFLAQLKTSQCSLEEALNYVQGETTIDPLTDAKLFNYFSLIKREFFYIPYQGYSIIDHIKETSHEIDELLATEIYILKALTQNSENILGFVNAGIDYMLAQTPNAALYYDSQNFHKRYSKEQLEVFFKTKLKVLDDHTAALIQQFPQYKPKENPIDCKKEDSLKQKFQKKASQTFWI